MSSKKKSSRTAKRKVNTSLINNAVIDALRVRTDLRAGGNAPPVPTTPTHPNAPITPPPVPPPVVPTFGFHH